jgi:hypothetical protein
MTSASVPRRAARRALEPVAERLETSGPAPWTGTVVDPATSEPHVTQLSPSLYDGLSGLAVGFAAVSEATGSLRFERLALEATRRTRAQLEAGALRHCDLGLEGLGGIAWAGLQVWSLLGAADAAACLKQACEALVARVSRRERAGAVDLVGGEAGALLAVLTLVEAGAVAGELLVATGRRLVDLLLDASLVVPEGRAWPIFDGHHIVGLGHGTSGIMLALHRSAPILDHRADEIAEVVDATIAFEDAAFDERIGNWRDERLPDDSEPWSCWCYGAAGTRYVRQRVGRPAPPGCLDPLDGRFPTADHLCCGRAGRLLLAGATDPSGFPGGARALAERVLDDALVLVGVADAEVPRSGPAGEVRRCSTSLFQGLPGVAYALVQDPSADAAAVLTLS